MWVKITNGTNTGKVTSDVWDRIQKGQESTDGISFNLEVYDPGDRFSDLMPCVAKKDQKPWKLAKATDPLR